MRFPVVLIRITIISKVKKEMRGVQECMEAVETCA